MKLPAPYKCDYCDKLKGVSNHWYLRMTDDDTFRLTTWDEQLADIGRVEHICGRECASKALAKWLEGKPIK